jgi:hypothetical protein
LIPSSLARCVYTVDPPHHLPILISGGLVCCGLLLRHPWLALLLRSFSPVDTKAISSDRLV